MEREALVYCDRRHTDSMKWDGMEASFSRGDLDPFWVADMDFQSPRCVRQAVEDWARMAIIRRLLVTSRPFWTGRSAATA